LICNLLDEGSGKIPNKRGSLQNRRNFSCDEIRLHLTRAGLLSEVHISTLPAGIDTIHAEVILSRNSYKNQTKFSEGLWEQRCRSKTGEAYYVRAVQDNKGNQLFYFKLYRHIRTNPDTKKTKDAWILQVQFNPSQFMYLTGTIGAVQGENYIAGNALALKSAMSQLQKLLRSEGFNKLETLERIPLDATIFKLVQVHLTRDYRLTPVDLKFRKKYSWRSDSRACWENDRALDILALFANSSPKYVHRFDDAATEYTVLEDHIKDLTRKSPKREIDAQRRRELKKMQKMMAGGRNPLRSRLNYIPRRIKTRHDVFYVKERYNDKNQYRGAAPRFELKLLTSDEIKILGVANLESLYQELVQVDVWHEQGQTGRIPCIESEVDKRLYKWIDPSAESRDKSKLTYFPIPDEYLPNFMIAVQQEVYESQRKAGLFVSDVCAGGSEDPTIRAHSLKLEDYFAGHRPTPRERCGVCEKCQKADHIAYLDRIRANIVDEAPLDFAAREMILSNLKVALTVLKPITLYQIAGRVAGFLDHHNQPTALESARKPYANLQGWIDYFLDFYDGEFFGISRSDQREIVTESLTLGRPTEE
jgi:hypothetical protein